MSKLRKVGRYQIQRICAPCGWFQLPHIWYGQIQPYLTICPTCGEGTEERVGRYTYDKKRSFWFGETNTNLNFELKLKRTPPPKEE